MSRPAAHCHTSDEYRRAVAVGQHLADVGVAEEEVRAYACREWKDAPAIAYCCIAGARRRALTLTALRTGIDTDAVEPSGRWVSPSSLTLQ